MPEVDREFLAANSEVETVAYEEPLPKRSWFATRWGRAAREVLSKTADPLGVVVPPVPLPLENPKAIAERFAPLGESRHVPVIAPPEDDDFALIIVIAGLLWIALIIGASLGLSK